MRTESGLELANGLLLSLLECGGQGRNRTADASLFRAVRSIAYVWPCLKTQDLRVNGLDSIWMPETLLGRFGLHVDSTNGHHHKACSGTERAPTRAVDSAF